MPLEANKSSTLIDCPGDTIIYTCGIVSNSEMVHLTWHITFPGHMPINITYDNSSTMDNLDMNISVNLTRYEADRYIESEIILTILKNITMNGTVLECSIAPSLDSDVAIILVNTSGMYSVPTTYETNLINVQLYCCTVPLPPINLRITRENHTVSNVTVTFEWDAPQGNGPEVIIEIYEVTIMPMSSSLPPASRKISSTSWNMTLNYNTMYIAIVTAENCAGISRPATLGNVKFREFHNCIEDANN